MNRIDFICGTCSKIFKEYQSNRTHEHIFCSHECHGSYLKTKLKYNIEQELLWALYWGNKHSLRKIGRLFDTDSHTIRRRMDLYDIPIRNRSETAELFDNYHVIGKSPWNKDKTHKEDGRIPSGDKSGGWIDGRSSENEYQRKCKSMKDWRNQVFERDGYRCQICHEVSGKLNAHHIKSFAEYPDDRFNVDNGITLCKDCHKWVHNLNVLDFQ